MTRYGAVFLCGIVMPLNLGLRARDDSDGAVRNEALAAQERYQQALVHSDIAALEKLLADDVRRTDPSGRTFNKQQWLDVIRPRSSFTTA